MIMVQPGPAARPFRELLMPERDCLLVLVLMESPGYMGTQKWCPRVSKGEGFPYSFGTECLF